MSSYKEKTPGAWWDWSYKGALPPGSNIPNFEIQGRKGLLGMLFGRKTLTSSQLANNKVSVICFLPKPDHSTDQFASSLVNATKTAVTISRHISNIHLCVTCANLEEFDTKIANRIPSSVNIWADVNGEVAEKFGVKPMIAEVDVADILSTKQTSKARYSKQTVPCLFFCIGNTVVKSPAMQPKLQHVSLDTLKSVLEAIEAVQFSATASMDSKHLASSLTESEIQTRYSKDWSTYLVEYQQMQEDLGLKVPTTTSQATKKVRSTSKPQAKPSQVKSKTDGTTTTKKKKTTASGISGTTTNNKAGKSTKTSSTTSTNKSNTAGGVKKKTPAAKKKDIVGEKNLLKDGSIRSRL